MKIVNESIFVNSIRSFFVALFAMVGILVGLVIIGIIFVAVISSEEKESYSSKVKILADADGNREDLGSSVPVILQIAITSEIGGENLNAEKIHNILLDSREDDFKNDRVKAVLVVFNSPGGGVHDSDAIYHMLLEYKKKYSTPIYAFVEGICASGGYYIACACDKIYSTNIGLVGSIGVLSWPPFFNVTDVMKKIGVESMTLYAGKGKDEMNPLRPWKEGEQDNYQKMLEFYYSTFVSIVTQNRPQISKEKLVQDYGARVYPAPEAKELGYIDDDHYTREKTLKELALLAGISDKYQVVTFQTTSWWKKLLESNASLFSGKLVHEHKLYEQDLGKHPCAYIYR